MYAWVTEKEIGEDRYAIIFAEDKDPMLDAFALRKADLEKSKGYACRCYVVASIEKLGEIGPKRIARKWTTMNARRN